MNMENPDEDTQIDRSNADLLAVPEDFEPEQCQRLKLSHNKLTHLGGLARLVSVIA